MMSPIQNGSVCILNSFYTMGGSGDVSSHFIYASALQCKPTAAHNSFMKVFLWEFCWLILIATS